MLGSVVCGSRTWIWTIPAPALAASTEDCAISAGVTGTAGFLLGLSAEPVTAQEMMTLRRICGPSWFETARARGRAKDQAEARAPPHHEGGPFGPVAASLPRILRCA